MAYKNLVGKVCVSKEEAFQRFRDFICKRNGTYDYSTTGIGWTLHDAVYAIDEDSCAINDYFVIYSPGESGKEDLYFKVKWINNNIVVSGFLSWDASTHVGSAINYATSSNFYLLEVDPLQFYVYGDLDFVCAINKRAINEYRTVFFGKISKPYEDISEEIVHCSSTLLAGADVSITVDSMPSNWAVGKEVYIRTTHNNDMATTKIEKITIKTLVSLTITADLVNSYTVGSALTDHVGYICQDTTAAMGATKTLILPTGVADNQGVTWSYNTGLTLTNNDPAAYENRIGLYTNYVQFVPGVIGTLTNIKRTPPHNAEFTNEDILTQDDTTEWRCFKLYSNIYCALKEV